MPQILVVTDSAEEAAGAVVYSERVSSTDLASAHFSGQLVERVGWAVRDADAIEQTDSDRRSVPRPRRREFPAAA